MLKQRIKNTSRQPASSKQRGSNHPSSKHPSSKQPAAGCQQPWSTRVPRRRIKNTNQQPASSKQPSSKHPSSQQQAAQEPASTQEPAVNKQPAAISQPAAQEPATSHQLTKSRMNVQRWRLMTSNHQAERRYMEIDDYAKTTDEVDEEHQEQRPAEDEQGAMEIDDHAQTANQKETKQGPIRAAAQHGDMTRADLEQLRKVINRQAAQRSRIMQQEREDRSRLEWFG